VYDSKFSGNEDTAYGIEKEMDARELYISKTGAELVQTGLFAHPVLPWLGFSPDGIILDENQNPAVLLEIKCLQVGKTTAASDLCKVVPCYNRKNNKLKEKHGYYGQIQLGMLLLGLKNCDFILFSDFDKDISVETVPFNEQFAVKMVASLTDVYFDKILPWLQSKKGH